jgi:pilus assembly protein CpaB
MRVVTMVSLAASAVLGLGALVVAKTVLPHTANAKAAPEQAGVPVVVAVRDIKFGTKLDAGMLTVVKLPQTAAPQAAFTSVAQVLAADHGGAPVALTPIAIREAILPAKLSGPGARPTVSAEVAEGMRAYSFKVNDATGVGGHALPGDRVDVVLMRDLTPTGPTRSFISYVIVQNARLLGVDLNADPSSEKPASPNTATIEVSVEDAQKLSIASTLGTLSLALRRTGEAEMADAGPMRTTDFLVGGGVRVDAPRAVAARGPRGPAALPVSGILFIEGAAVKHSRRTAGKAGAPPVLNVPAPAASSPTAPAAANAIG